MTETPDKIPDFTDWEQKRLGDMFRLLSANSGAAPAEKLKALQQVESVLIKRGTTFEQIGQHPEWLTGAGGARSVELENLCKEFEAANKSLAAQADAVIAENKKLREHNIRLIQRMRRRGFADAIFPEGKMRGSDIVEFEFLGRDSRRKLFLTVTPVVCDRIADRVEEIIRLSGSDKIDAMLKLGALRNDVKIDGMHYPAEQKFCLLTGQRTDLAHYLNDELNDTADGDPARQCFDERTGQRIYLAHFQNGIFSDCTGGDPAEQWFDIQTGRRTRLAHRLNGVMSDIAEDDPAAQWFDASTDLITRASSYKNGWIIKYFSPQELEALNRAKGLLPGNSPPPGTPSPS